MQWPMRRPSPCCLTPPAFLCHLFGPPGGELCVAAWRLLVVGLLAGLRRCHRSHGSLLSQHTHAAMTDADTIRAGVQRIAHRATLAATGHFWRPLLAHQNLVSRSWVTSGVAAEGSLQWCCLRDIILSPDASIGARYTPVAVLTPSTACSKNTARPCPPPCRRFGVLVEWTDLRPRLRGTATSGKPPWSRTHIAATRETRHDVRAVRGFSLFSPRFLRWSHARGSPSF